MEKKFEVEFLEDAVRFMDELDTKSDLIIASSHFGIEPAPPKPWSLQPMA